ncbi:MAG: nucleotidyltransferase family protein [Caldilineaceae bacterium]|nr:nucleotidyltransferase family protein [Caldilineaceae bacterium]
MTVDQIFPHLLVEPNKVASQARLFTHEDWSRVLQIVRRTHLVALLHYGIAQVGIELPLEFQESMRDLLRLATFDALQKRAELARILAELNDTNLPPILFKGAVLAHTVYPSYTHRPMGDIDLWVPHAQMAQAQSVLESLGYRYKEKVHRSHAMQSLGDGELQMRGQTALQGLVELHYGVFAGEWLRIAANVDRQAVYDRLVATEIDGQSVLHLAPEDAFIQIALHVSINHQMTVNGLRSLVDLEFLSRQGMDWETVGQRCWDWRLYTAVSFVIDLWDQLIASEQSSQAAAALPFRRPRLLRLFVEAQDLLEGHSLSQNRWRLLYQLALVDQGRSILRLIAHTLWPDRAWLKARYADTNRWTRLQHFRQVVSGKV